jgi:hypothetical protein
MDGNWRHSKRTNMSDQNQIAILVQSSSILGKLASILEADPEVLSPAPSGRRTSRRVQKRESVRVAGLVKKSFEDSIVLLTPV